MIQQALLSVSDKTGIVDFARALHERGVKRAARNAECVEEGAHRRAGAD